MEVLIAAIAFCIGFIVGFGALLGHVKEKLRSGLIPKIDGGGGLSWEKP